MNIPPVFIIQGGNGRNRLTVAKNRISLKLREDITEEDETHLILFAQMIAQRTLPIYRRTMRGCFSSDLQSIEMMNTSRSKFCLYCFDELECEGFSTDQVASDEVKSRKKKWTGIGYSQTQASGYGGLYEDWDMDRFVD